MKGVKFGNFHSYYEWGLVLSEKEIQAPKPKLIELEIEGSDGVLDYTEFFGGVKYENRKLTFSFSKPNIVSDGFLALFSLVQEKIHGKKMQVILDDDPTHFYYGRVTVDEWNANKRVGEIVIEVDADPYKQEIEETRVVQTVSGNANIVLSNTKMPASPTITTNAEFLIDFGSYNDIYPAGTFTIPELELGEGDNDIYVEGTGTIAFSWRKGRL